MVKQLWVLYVMQGYQVWYWTSLDLIKGALAEVCTVLSAILVLGTLLLI